MARKYSLSRAVNPHSLKRIGGMLIGVGIGTFISKKLADTVQTSGIEGIQDYAHYLAPAAVAVGSLMIHQNASDSFVKDIAIGASVSGASTIVNNFMGRQVVTLNGDVEPMLPGVGDVPLLPSENYAATHYEETQDINADEVPVNPTEGIGSDLDPVNLHGIEEAAIV